MVKYTENDFNNFILDNGLAGINPEGFNLSSGGFSHFYVNWRNVSNDAFMLNTLADYILDFVDQNNIEVDTFYGVPDGATKVATHTQMEYAKRDPNFGPGSHVIAMGRKTPKSHGDPKDSHYVGFPEGKTLKIEDVITTSGSLIKSFKSSIDHGIDVVGAVILTLRPDMNYIQDKVNNELQREMPIYVMSHAHKLIPQIYDVDKYGKEIGNHIEKEFQQTIPDYKML